MRKVLAVLALTTIALTGCSTAPMARVSQNFQPAHSADFTTATHKALTAPVAPVAQPVAPEPVATPAQPVAQPVAPVAPVAQPVAPVQVAQPTAVAPAPRCEEDQPCWDCHTMGNLQCGPVASVVAPTAPVAQPVAIKPVDQGGHASAGKDAPVGPAPEGVKLSPVYNSQNCPEGIKYMSEAGCPEVPAEDTTAPVEASQPPMVDTCEADLNDLLSADSDVTNDNVVSMHSDGQHCTITTTK